MCVIGARSIVKRLAAFQRPAVVVMGALHAHRVPELLDRVDFKLPDSLR